MNVNAGRIVIATMTVAMTAVPAALGVDLRSPDTRERASQRTTEPALARNYDGVETVRSRPSVEASIGRRFDAVEGIRWQPGSDSAPATIAAPSSFDWVDAGIGAIGAFGLSTLCAALLILLRRREKVGQHPGPAFTS
jgi:hypothetical protein